MIDRIATVEYRRAGGARVTLALDRYENEPDFQAYALTRFVDPHDPSFATFSGFDVRDELAALLDSTFADMQSPEFAGARVAVLGRYDEIDPL